MAKKARTPAPPRQVQAPQLRSEPSAARTPEPRRTLWILTASAADRRDRRAAGRSGVLVHGRRQQHDSVTDEPADDSNLIGLQIGQAPLESPDSTTLTDRAQAVGISSLPTEGTELHIHQHLDIFVNGKHVTVPA